MLLLSLMGHANFLLILSSPHYNTRRKIVASFKSNWRKVNSLSHFSYLYCYVKSIVNVDDVIACHVIGQYNISRCFVVKSHVSIHIYILMPINKL